MEQVALDQSRLEVHIFERAGAYYAFDSRNYAIMKLDLASAAVLERMPRQGLDAIVSELREFIPAERIRAIYCHFLEMIAAGVLSSEPVPRPKRPPFDHLVLMLAGGCNMGCAYCFEKDVPIYQKPNLMSRETADRILDWFEKHHEGTKAHLQLYGGEPLLNWPVLEHVVRRTKQWAEANDISLTKYLITNGTLLNPARVDFLAANDVTVQVSVDGDAETHNRFRVMKSGKPTMHTIAPHIGELADAGVDFNLRAVLTRQNRDPAKVLAGLRSHGASKVSFEVVATDNDQAQFTDDDWREFNAAYRSLVSQPFATWEALPDDMQSMIARICDGRRIFYGCGAGISEVTVAPDGSIYECQRIYRTPYSNVGEDRSPTELASTLLTMVDDRPVCRDCWARYLCGGGCMHQSHVGHGSDEPLPQYCTMKRELVEASIVKIS